LELEVGLVMSGVGLMESNGVMADVGDLSDLGSIEDVPSTEFIMGGTFANGDDVLEPLKSPVDLESLTRLESSGGIGSGADEYGAGSEFGKMPSFGLSPSVRENGNGGWGNLDESCESLRGSFFAQNSFLFEEASSEPIGESVAESQTASGGAHQDETPVEFEGEGAVQEWIAGVASEEEEREERQQLEQRVNIGGDDVAAEARPSPAVKAEQVEAAEATGATQTLPSSRKRKAPSSSACAKDAVTSTRPEKKAMSAVERAMQRAEDFANESLGEKKIEWNVMRRRAGLEVVDENGDQEDTDGEVVRDGSDDKRNSKKYKLRLQKNRDSAYVSRIRRRYYTRFLEESLGNEEREKKSLQSRVDTLQKEVDSLMRVFEKTSASQGKKVQGAAPPIAQAPMETPSAMSSSSVKSLGSNPSKSKVVPPALTAPVIRMASSTHESMLRGLRSVLSPIGKQPNVTNPASHQTATTMCIFVFLFGLMLPGFGPSGVSSNSAMRAWESADGGARVAAEVVDQSVFVLNGDVSDARFDAAKVCDSVRIESVVEESSQVNLESWSLGGGDDCMNKDQVLQLSSSSSWRTIKVVFSGVVVCLVALLIDASSFVQDGAVKVPRIRAQ